MVDLFRIQPIVTEQPRRRIRNRKSTRGKFNTPFSQFMEATKVVRKVVKYTFIIWALVLGIVALFYLPSITMTQSPETAVENNTSQPGSATDGNFKTESNATSDQQAKNKSNTATLDQPDNRPETDEVNTSSIAEPTETTPDKSIETSTPEIQATKNRQNNLSVSAYRATLFSAINIEHPVQTPLQINTELQLIEQQGEWIKVQVKGTGDVGFIHSSQVNN